MIEIIIVLVLSLTIIIAAYAEPAIGGYYILVWLLMVYDLFEGISLAS